MRLLLLSIILLIILLPLLCTVGPCAKTCLCKQSLLQIILITYFCLLDSSVLVLLLGNYMQEASGSSEACAPSLFGEAVNYPTTPDTMKDFPATIPVTATAMKVRSLAAGQVDRTVSAALPDGMHVSKDARIAFQKAATLFLFYLSCLAEDERSREGRKRVTLSAHDIKSALKAAGMSHLLPLLGTSHMKRIRTDDNSFL
ncbi:hypothetical protein TcG_00163 [Trypanosoma cruzi]|nr:hypothetical protein TcBrA4_0103380 [Trypanosoma cruzi]RNF25162.1 hypothetical protein TcG_00163 [Trypanosoma cruzi]